MLVWWPHANPWRKPRCGENEIVIGLNYSTFSFQKCIRNRRVIKTEPNYSIVVSVRFGTLHFRERFISMPTFLWVHIAKNFSILYWLAISCDRSDWLPQDIGGIPIHLFCDIIHVHPRWRAHPRAHVILDRALLHSWCMQKFEIFTRKSDPEFFEFLVRVRASSRHYCHCESK